MADKKTIDYNEAVNNVHIMADRLANFYYFTVTNLIKEFGEEKADDLITKIVRDYGLDCGQKTRLSVEKAGYEPVMENFKLGKDLPTVGWKNEKYDTNDTNSQATECSFCPFANTWKKLNFEKWGRKYCLIDQAKFEGYSNGDLDCFHDKNLLDGDDVCIIRVVKK